MPELRCDHEEADTRIFLHAQHAASNGYKSIIIAADDTDVLMIALGPAHIIGCQMYQRKRTSVHGHYIDVGRVANRHSIDLCSSLIGIHAFTGCDSVGAFAGKGKIIPVKILQQLPTYQLTFGNFGQSFDVTNQQLQELESFVCLLYLSQTIECSDINECRCMMFCGKKGEADSSQLPPCHDTLRQHVLRANYQAAIWRRSCQAQMDIPTPNGNGWNLDPESNQLAIEWMTGIPTPQAVLDLLSCVTAVGNAKLQPAHVLEMYKDVPFGKLWKCPQWYRQLHWCWSHWWWGYSWLSSFNVCTLGTDTWREIDYQIRA